MRIGRREAGVESDRPVSTRWGSEKSVLHALSKGGRIDNRRESGSSSGKRHACEKQRQTRRRRRRCARAIESGPSFSLLSHSLSSRSRSLNTTPIPPPQPGKWGVVTGATDGIGRAYANALAKAGEIGVVFLFSTVEERPKQANGKPSSTSTSTSSTPPLSPALPVTLPFHSPGLNVALLSRTESKLTAAASEIEAKYNVQTKVVAVDFGAATAADYGRIAGVIGDLDVAVLVNNVGMSYDHAEYYDAIDDKLIDDLIAINIQATNKVS